MADWDTAQQSKFSASEKAKEAEREVAMRVKVYPGSMDRGRLSEADAARRIEIMQEIAADYRAQARKQEQLPL